MSLAAEARVLAGWEALAPNELFRGLPEWLDHSQPWLITAAFLVLLSGHLWRVYDAGRTGRAVVHEWYITLLTLAFLLSAPVLSQWGREAAGDWLAHLPGAEPEGVTRRCLRLAATYPSFETLLAWADAERTEAGDWPANAWYPYVDETWLSGLEEDEARQWLENGDVSPAHSLAVQTVIEAKARTFVIAEVVTVSSLVAAGAIAWLMDGVRALLLTVGLWALPLVLAALRVHWLRGSAQRCLLILVAGLGWPFVWKVGHQVTAILFDRWVVEYGGPEGDVSAWLWTSIDTATSLSPGPSWLARDGMVVPTEWCTSVSLGAVGLLVWVTLVVFGLPYLLQRALTGSIQLTQANKKE